MTTTTKNSRDTYYATHFSVYSVRTGLRLGAFSSFLDGFTYWTDEDGNRKSARDAKVEVRDNDE